MNRIGMIRAMAAALIGAATIGPGEAGGDYTFSMLVDFDYNTNGAFPLSPLLLDADGSLYGTTERGTTGAGYGTVFKLDPTTGVLTTLADFGTGHARANPMGRLAMDSAGNIYGATARGALGNGTVFKLDPITGAVTTLAEFSGSIGDAPGAVPRGGVTLDAAGNLYGITSNSGPGQSQGTVFKIDASTGALTTLHAFGPGDSGKQPYAAVVLDANGDIYGTTYGSSLASGGTVFKIDAATGAVSYPALFNTANGASPQAAVTIDALGNIYGTTTGGGDSNGGTVFKIDAGTGLLTTLVSFDRTNGWAPYAGVTFDAVGNIYGTTSGGGLYDFGTVFRIDATTGILTTIFSFDRDDGISPRTEVTLDAHGNIYGTTASGGPDGYGTIFRLSPTSAVVPEPTSLVMIAIGTVTAGVVLRRRDTFKDPTAP